MTECQKKKRGSKVSKRDLRHFSLINWRKETERTVGQCGDGLCLKTKGRKTVSHFSCAWTSFPAGRKHGHKALSKKKKRLTYTITAFWSSFISQNTNRIQNRNIKMIKKRRQCEFFLSMVS